MEDVLPRVPSASPEWDVTRPACAECQVGLLRSTWAVNEQHARIIDAARVDR